MAKGMSETDEVLRKTDATIRYLQRRGNGPFCNCRNLWCWLDTACHILHIPWRSVCDKHDAHILRGT